MTTIENIIDAKQFGITNKTILDNMNKVLDYHGIDDIESDGLMFLSDNLADTKFFAVIFEIDTDSEFVVAGNSEKDLLKQLSDIMTGHSQISTDGPLWAERIYNLETGKWALVDVAVTASVSKNDYMNF